MKGHTSHHKTHAKHAVHHHHYAKGGHIKESPAEGVREYEEDIRSNPEARDNAHKVEHEAEARKHGGRAKRKRGGHVMAAAAGHGKHHAAGGHAKHHVHHEHGKHLAHAKHLGHVVGHKGAKHAGRKPRARGGSDMNPLSSAHSATHPAAHRDIEID
jgi:hypothetical protein